MEANKIAEYRNGGIKLDEMGAKKEILADFVGEMLFGGKKGGVWLSSVPRNKRWSRKNTFGNTSDEKIPVRASPTLPTTSRSLPAWRVMAK